MSNLLNRRRAGSVKNALQKLESDPSHHLAGPFLPQTPLGSPTRRSKTIPSLPQSKRSIVISFFREWTHLWADIISLKWMIDPGSSFKLLLIPLIPYIFCALINPHSENPFAPFFFISHYIQSSSSNDPRYAKGWLDFIFIAYYVVVFSFVRQIILYKVMKPVALYLGIKKRAKVDRFGEQGYAMLYWGTMGAWGVYLMSTLPTWWYQTKYFWIDYPHWKMNPVVKRYYLMQLSYWLHQLIIIALKLEKPRKDYQELVAHHIVTLWLIGWSYGINLTYIGNAIFVSMDIPDAFFALAKICNYLGMEIPKMVVFVSFVAVWTYFRHWLNLVILWSVWNEIDLVPESSKRWAPQDGVFMDWWVEYQVFLPLFLLQLLNLFWYFLILRILYRALFTTEGATDVRSDSEEEKEDN